MTKNMIGMMILSLGMPLLASGQDLDTLKGTSGIDFAEGTSAPAMGDASATPVIAKESSSKTTLDALTAENRSDASKKAEVPTPARHVEPSSFTASNVAVVMVAVGLYMAIGAAAGIFLHGLGLGASTASMAGGGAIAGAAVVGAMVIHDVVDKH